MGGGASRGVGGGDKNQPRFASMYAAMRGTPPCATRKPIVGILTAPLCEENPSKGSFFRETYVQWLEQGGCRVAVIPYDAPFKELERLWSGINGVLFTGGDLSLLADTIYFKAAKFLYDLTMKAADQSVQCPIWGTCMGMQLLSILAAGDDSVLERYGFDSHDVCMPLHFTENADNSFLFGQSPPHIKEAFRTQNVTANFHHDGVTPQAYNTSQKLRAVFNVLSTNVDMKGKEFVSTLEGKTAPLIAVQWHPERIQFSWDPKEPCLVHTFEAVECMTYISHRFVELTRRCPHTFPTAEEELKALRYRHTPIPGLHGTSKYIFPPWEN
ncbi:gamma-glutamyl hydrolase [Pelomyxa schiedti]|nr:gamma-glutamyl hydrolase [Pelomyxa schiedti]